tara:strand:- start:251 stop:643 length:393 start_codon:yes stop_codon:yes gene_type:complete
MIMYKITQFNIIHRLSDNCFIPNDSGNRHYQQYISDIKTYGLDIVTCESIDKKFFMYDEYTTWQYLDNAEQIIIDKYGSDSEKITALREYKYVRAMEAKFPFEKKIDAYKIIDATPQDIKDKYNHLPMRR